MRLPSWPLYPAILCVAPALFAQSTGRDAKYETSSRSKIVKEITNTLSMRLLFVPPGEFLMGSTPAEIERARVESGTNWYDNEGPKHKVRITKGFHLAILPVTQAQYRRLMGTNPSWFSIEGRGSDAVASLDTHDFPVDSVSWNDAKDFCATLSRREARTYRLPTEAEWEYACRAGTTLGFNTGDDQADLDRSGWFKDNSQAMPHAVGKLAPNPWGFYDMHGNVVEWCEDLMENGFYEHSPSEDPTGPTLGEYHVLRGGSWRMIAWSCRSASRLYARPDDHSNDNGFRVILAP